MHALLSLFFLATSVLEPAGHLLTTLVMNADDPFKTVIDNVVENIKPLTVALFTLGIVASALGTLLSSWLPEQAQANKGWFLKGGMAAIVISIAPQIATWVVGLAA
jgi:hypothetical protein